MSTAIELKYISKNFPGVKALDNVGLKVGVGEIHALVGENGAGKSTLIKIISGAYTVSQGEIVVFGERLSNIDPHKMINKGVAVIYQELMLAEHMSVAENIFLGKYPKTSWGTIDERQMVQETRNLCKELALDLDPREIVGNLSVAKKQMVEIIKAMSKNAKIIILDEPTAVLGEKELEGLFSLVKRLARKGVSFIYISHRLEEIFHLADRVTILKDGKKVCTKNVSDLTKDQIVRFMVGREVSDIYPIRMSKCRETLLKVDNLSVDFVNNVTFEVRGGEILGIAGLAGAGRTEILRAIVGADRMDSGQLRIKDVPVRISDPGMALKYGIGILPEERKTQGLFVQQDVKFNFSILKFKEFMKGILISNIHEKKACLTKTTELNIKPRDNISFIVKNMSGGNQQKVVFSKLMNASCQILLLDEPTRGVDVGAKHEIYNLINKLASEGVAIILVSSDLPEILGMSDRIAVMREGKLVTITATETASEESIMSFATC